MTADRGPWAANRQPLVSVILVTWNSAPFLPRCLSGLAAQTHDGMELIAVDNGSSDGSADLVAATFPHAAIICNETNTGFAHAVNQGVAVARWEFVLLLNPDAMLSPEYVERVVVAMTGTGAQFGAAAGKLMQARGTSIEPTDMVDSKGIRMTRTGRHIDIGQGRPDGADDRGLEPIAGTGLFEVFGVSGAAAMLRATFVRDAMIDGQLLDEDFFTFREDADLAWRGRILGWRALHVPDAVGWHVRTVTPKRRKELSATINMHSVKNRFLLRLKNEAAYLAVRHAPFEIARDLLTVGAALTVERTSLPALRWLWQNRRRILEKRRAVQRRRRVPDRDIARWFR